MYSTLQISSPLCRSYANSTSAPGLIKSRLPACSITVGVVEAPTRSGRGTYRGTCSTYLASNPNGTAVYAFVRRQVGIARAMYQLQGTVGQLRQQIGK